MYDKNVIPNIDNVVSLLESLDFVKNKRIETLYDKINVLKEELNSSQKNHITNEQSEDINSLFGSLRDAVYSHGDSVNVCACDLAIPDKITLQWLFSALRTLTPGQVIGAVSFLAAIASAIFVAGHEWNEVPKCDEVEQSNQAVECVVMREPQGPTVSAPPAPTPIPAPALDGGSSSSGEGDSGGGPQRGS